MTPGIEGAALDTPVGIAVVPDAVLHPKEASPALLGVRRGVLLVAEIAGLWALNKAGQLVVRALHVHFPGNVAGMLILYNQVTRSSVDLTNAIVFPLGVVTT